MAVEVDVDPELRLAAMAWWKQLPDKYKGNCAIWMLLAMFAEDVLKGLAEKPNAPRE